MEKKLKKLEASADGKPQKLSLKRETIRSLAPDELEGAVGAAIWTYRWSTAACKNYDWTKQIINCW